MNRSRLGAEQVADIRSRAEAGYSITELATAFGRSRLSISRIVKGETYPHVDADAVAEFVPLKKTGGVSRIMRKSSPQDPPRVRHAPAPTPTTITHLGSAKDGPRCGVQALGRLAAYAATVEELRDVAGMVEVCKRCVQIGQQAQRKSFPPGPGF